MKEWTSSMSIEETVMKCPMSRGEEGKGTL